MMVDLPSIDFPAFADHVRRIADELTALRVMEERRLEENRERMKIQAALAADQNIFFCTHGAA